MDVQRFTEVLKDYPLTSFCFSPYMHWLASQSEVNISENDLLEALRKEDHERLKALETRLTESRDILSLSDSDFKTAFGFHNDLLNPDPEKVHDVLAEPLLVLDLSDHGFTKIRKLPRFIKNGDQKIAVADFVGKRDEKTYAIELKTIRTENNQKRQPGKPSGNALQANWWINMLRNNIITKIEDKNRKALTQLSNTKHHMECDYTMLALDTRRLGPSTLMNTEEAEEVLAAIKTRYKQIDHLFLKDRFGEVVVVVPPLDTETV